MYIMYSYVYSTNCIRRWWFILKAHICRGCTTLKTVTKYNSYFISAVHIETNKKSKIARIFKFKIVMQCKNDTY